MKDHRKLIVALAAILTAFALAWTHRLTGEFVTVITVIAGGFYAGNVFGDHRK